MIALYVQLIKLHKSISCMYEFVQKQKPINSLNIWQQSINSKYKHNNKKTMQDLS